MVRNSIMLILINTGMSSQECHCGYWGTSSGYENLWRLHTVLVLDSDVSHAAAFINLELPLAFFTLIMLVCKQWNQPSLLTPSPLYSGLVIAMLTSLLFIILLRYLAGIMVWIMIALVILVIGYGKLKTYKTCCYLCCSHFEIYHSF